MKMRFYLTTASVALLIWTFSLITQNRNLEQTAVSNQSAQLAKFLAGDLSQKLMYVQEISLSALQSTKDSYLTKIRNNFDALPEKVRARNVLVEELRDSNIFLLYGTNNSQKKFYYIDMTKVLKQSKVELAFEQGVILLIVLIALWFIANRTEKFLYSELNDVRKSLIDLAQGKSTKPLRSNIPEFNEFKNALNYIAFRSEMLLKANNMHLEVVARETRKLENDKSYLDSVVTSVHEGLIVIDERFTIQDGISERAKILLREKSLKGQNFINLLSELTTSSDQEIEGLKGCLLTAFNLFLPEQFLDVMKNAPHHLPIKNGDHNLLYEFNYSPYVEGDEIKKIIITFKDEGDKQALKDIDTYSAMQALDGLVQIHDHLSDPWRLESLLEFSEEHIVGLEKAILHIKGDYKINETFRILHTLKGSARALSLHFLDTICHESESIMSKSRKGEILTDEDKMLLKTYLTSMQSGLISIRDLILVSHMDKGKKDSSWPLVWQNFIDEIEESMSEIADEKNKKIAIHWEDLPAPMKDKDFRFLKHSLVHLMRNALDHGIEIPQERVIKNKPETGIISINIENDNGLWALKISDDGRGIDKEILYRKAEEKGIEIDQWQSWTNKEILVLLCHPGFSSRDSVDHISGRGVGMDAVACEVREAGGHFSLEKTNECGTLFKITWPEIDDFDNGENSSRYSMSEPITA